MFSERERIAHVVRRLGVGANPSLVAELDTVDSAITRMLDLPSTMVEAPQIEAPPDWDSVDYEVLGAELVPWWLDTMAAGTQPLAERLIWFWHDHLAVSGDKVDHSFVLWEHHRTVRRLATANFADLLKAVSKDAAMLWYLDGADNEVGTPNENFAREVMELHTLGHGTYTQDDVAEIARAFTGWVVNEPHYEEDGFMYPAEAPWTAVFEPERFDSTAKTLLGRRSQFGMDEALDVLLAQPDTGRYVGAAMYRHLVGLEPPPATIHRLGTVFSRDYDTLELVAEIVADPAFVSDEAVRAKMRTPVEKAITVLQGLPRSEEATGDWLFWMLAKLHYLPLHPPNPAGFPPGPALLDPARLLGSFELLNMAANVDDESGAAVDPLEALGLYDVSAETRSLLDRFPRPGLRLGLAFGSPEFQVV